MRIAILSFLLVFMSCASSKNSASLTEIANLKDVVSNKKIEATFNWANPTGLINNVRGIENLFPPGSNASSISLTGNSNFFRLMGDRIHMDLPYYGQQRHSRGYNTDGGVKYDGKATNFSQEFNQKKNAQILKYSLRDKTESYDVTLTLYANKKSNLNINSSHRTNISYNGTWKELKEISQ